MRVDGLFQLINKVFRNINLPILQGTLGKRQHLHISRQNMHVKIKVINIMHLLCNSNEETFIAILIKTIINVTLGLFVWHLF